MRIHSDASSGAFVPRRPHLDAVMRPYRPAVERHPRTQAAVALLDKRGVVSFCSPAMEALFHSSQAQLEGCEVAALLPGLPLREITPDYNLAFAESWDHKTPWRRLNGLSPDGESVLLEISLKKLSMNSDQYILLGMRPADDDGTLVEELSRLIEGAKAKSDAVLIADNAGIVVFVNAAFEEKSGYARTEVVGQHASVVQPDFHDPDFYKKMWETLLAGNEFHSIFTNRRKDGEIVHEDAHIRPFIDGFGVTTHFVLSSRSLSEPLRTTLRRLQREAYHDALTGLPNRNLFLDRLGQAFSRASRSGEKFSLVYIDLDDFKSINDACGHAGGDAVLRATAHSLNSSVRDEDTVARLGGDEFALILLNVHQAEDIERVCGKILLSLTQGVGFDSQRIAIRASLGASIYPDDAKDSETLLRQADFAMYAAKSAGGHCLHFFSPEDMLSRSKNADARADGAGVPEDETPFTSRGPLQE